MLNCSHACKPTPSGPKCYCDRGQKPNGALCEDFDECSIDGVCDQKCENTPGSYMCRCIDGYASVNKTHCKAINGNLNKIYYVKELIVTPMTLDIHFMNFIRHRTH